MFLVERRNVDVGNKACETRVPKMARAGILGDGTVLAGFYSYGEISPFTPDARCELHNQTMTITTFSERTS